MSTTVEPSVRVEVAGEAMTLTLPDGKSVSFAWKKNPRMKGATAAQLKNFKVTPYGIHWPDLDEDLSFRGLACGQFGF
jgi:hypothetical protein